MNLRRLYDVGIRRDMKERGRHIADGRGERGYYKFKRNLDKTIKAAILSASIKEE